MSEKLDTQSNSDKESTETKPTPSSDPEGEVTLIESYGTEVIKKSEEPSAYRSYGTRRTFDGSDDL